MANAKVIWLLIAIASVVAVAICKGLRWWYLYPPHHRPESWAKTFSILMTTQMLNILLPIRLGEVARLGLMLQDKIPAGMTLSTIIGEKSLDLIAIGLLVVLAVPISILPNWFPSSAGVAMGVVGLLLLTILNLVWLRQTWVKKTAQQVLGFRGWLPTQWQHRIMRLVNAAMEGLGTLAGFKSALPVMALTMFSWLLSISTMIAVLNAFALPTDWHVALLLSLALYLSNLIPTPPALIGIVSAVTIMVLKWFGIARPDATAVGLALNVILVGPLVLLGGWSIWNRLSKLTTKNIKEQWAWSLGLKKKT